MKDFKRNIFLLFLFALFYSLSASGLFSLRYLTFIAYIPLFLLYFLIDKKSSMKDNLVYVYIFFGILFVMFFIFSSWILKVSFWLNIIFVLIANFILSCFIFVTLFSSIKFKSDYFKGVFVISVFISFVFLILQKIGLFIVHVNPASYIFELGWLIKSISQFGVIFLIMIFNFSIAYLIYQLFFSNKKKSFKKLSFICSLIFSIIICSVFILTLVYNNYFFVEEKVGLRMGLIQSNMAGSGAYDKLFPNEFFDSHYNYSKNLTLDNVDLVIWPEYAIPFSLETSFDWLEQLQNLSSVTDTVIVGGMKNRPYEPFSEFKDKAGNDTFHNESEIYDSVFVVYPSGKYEVYNSTNLAPTNDVSSTGKYSPLVFNVKNTSFGILICWEESDLKLAGIYKDLGVDYFVIISNDNQFKDDIRAYDLARTMSSILTSVYGIPQIRLAKSGYSFVLNSNAKTIDTLPFKKAVSKIIEI